MNLRMHAHWMVQLDDRLLELLAQEGALTPGTIREYLNAAGSEMEYSDMDVSVRCDTLANVGLLSFDESSIQYKTTAAGREYLRGDFDASNLTCVLPNGSRRSVGDQSNDVNQSK